MGKWVFIREAVKTMELETVGKLIEVVKPGGANLTTVIPIPWNVQGLASLKWEYSNSSTNGD